MIVVNVRIVGMALAFKTHSHLAKGVFSLNDS